MLNRFRFTPEPRIVQLTMNTGRKGRNGSGTPDGSLCKPQAGERLHAGLRGGEAGRVRRDGGSGGGRADGEAFGVVQSVTR